MGGGYKEAPWIFKGRAIYQLQLVKSEEARKYIPSEFKLVEAFGYTLGGFYLARYEDSPVAGFDELVALAGLVWNAPTSCAWAARVYVSNKEARNHGLTHVGLPSRVASFVEPAGAQGATAATTSSSSRSSSSRPPSWWDKQESTAGKPCGALLELRNLERGARGLRSAVCSLQLPAIATHGFLGPRIRMSLPSFSGGTVDFPGLLQYSCDLRTNIMPVAPARVLLPQREGAEASQAGEGGGEVLDLVLSGRPLVALAFSEMEVRGAEADAGEGGSRVGQGACADHCLHAVGRNQGVDTASHPASAPAFTQLPNEILCTPPTAPRPLPLACFIHTWLAAVWCLILSTCSCSRSSECIRLSLP